MSRTAYIVLIHLLGCLTFLALPYFFAPDGFARLAELPTNPHEQRNLASHVQRKEAHRVAISFYSDPLTWIDTVDGRLLIAYGDQRDALQSGQPVSTDLVALQPNLSIWSYQPQPVNVSE